MKLGTESQRENCANLRGVMELSRAEVDRLVIAELRRRQGAGALPISIDYLGTNQLSVCDIDGKGFCHCWWARESGN